MLVRGFFFSFTIKQFVPLVGGFIMHIDAHATKISIQHIMYLFDYILFTFSFSSEEKVDGCTWHELFPVMDTSKSVFSTIFPPLLLMMVRTSITNSTCIMVLNWIHYIRCILSQILEITAWFTFAKICSFLAKNCLSICDSVSVSFNLKW